MLARVNLLLAPYGLTYDDLSDEQFRALSVASDDLDVIAALSAPLPPLTPEEQEDV